MSTTPESHRCLKKFSSRRTLTHGHHENTSLEATHLPLDVFEKMRQEFNESELLYKSEILLNLSCKRDQLVAQNGSPLDDALFSTPRCSHHSFDSDDSCPKFHHEDTMSKTPMTESLCWNTHSTSRTTPFQKRVLPEVKRSSCLVEIDESPHGTIDQTLKTPRRITPIRFHKVNDATLSSQKNISNSSTVDIFQHSSKVYIKQRPLLWNQYLTLEKEFELLDILKNNIDVFLSLGCEDYPKVTPTRRVASTPATLRYVTNTSIQHDLVNTSNGILLPSLYKATPIKRKDDISLFHTSSDDGIEASSSEMSNHVYDEIPEATLCGGVWPGPRSDVTPPRSYNATTIASLTPQREVTRFRKNRKELCKIWFNRFNQTVFDNRIPITTAVDWNSRLTRTAGQTLMTKSNGSRKVQIHLSPRVIDKEERLKSTLLHEMCHAAQFLLEHEEHPAHGPGFQKWAKRASTCWPNVPVTVTHNYVIHYPKRYQCALCGHVYGRYSKLRNLDTARCGKPGCRGSLIFLGHFDRTGTAVRKSSQQRELTPYNRFIKERFASAKFQNPQSSSRQIMSELVTEWRTKKEMLDISCSTSIERIQRKESNHAESLELIREQMAKLSI